MSLSKALTTFIHNALEEKSFSFFSATYLEMARILVLYFGKNNRSQIDEIRYKQERNSTLILVFGNGYQFYYYSYSLSGNRLGFKSLFFDLRRPRLWRVVSIY